MDDRDTRVVDPGERPPERTLYWALPNVVALVVVAAALGAAVGLLARGHAVLGSALLAVAVLVLLVLVQEAVRRRQSRFDALLAGGYDRARALSGYAGASLRTWSRTGGRVARLRLQAHALLRERRQAQFELGGAAYAGDAKAFGDMIDRLRSLDEQLARCAAETARAVEEAQSRLAQERLAISPTEIHRLH